MEKQNLSCLKLCLKNTTFTPQMKQQIAILMLYLSMFFLIGHTVVPHCHQQQDISHEVHLDDDSTLELIKFLKGIFDFDLGEGHFEIFYNSIGQNFVRVFFIASDFSRIIHQLLLSLFQEKIHFNFHFSESEFHSFFYSNFSFRGPPAASF